MPMLPGRPCRVGGCPVIGFCVRHQRQPVAPSARQYDDRRGSSTQRGYGYAWQQFRLRYLRAHPLCVMRCGRPATDVDHKLPRAQGGSDDEGNLQALCSRCHKAKTARERLHARG